MKRTLLCILIFIAFQSLCQQTAIPISPKDSIKTLAPAGEDISFDQQLNFSKNLLPPSPDASSLGEYASNAPNLYTGVLPINIPLYTLIGRGISLPIGLSYMARGNKVGETASWIGLGWALNAGGVITSSIRGLPDTDVAGYFNTRLLYQNPSNLSVNPINNDNDLKVEAAKGLRDYAPDLYMLNAMGRSYRLIFGISSAGVTKIVTQPYSDIKIDVDFTTNTWTVLLEDGTKMIFGSSSNFTEKINNPFAGEPASDINEAVISWYLKSVQTPNSEVINFTYTQNNILQDGNYFEVEYKNKNSSSSATKPPIGRGKNVSVSTLNLASIETNLAKIEFITDSRLDLYSGNRLTDINVYDKTKTPIALVNHFKLNQNYSTATAGNTYTMPNNGLTGDTHKYRLKLASVDETIDNSTKKTWSFGYNATNLPSRHSYAQDHWGFYNGATTNTTLKPATTHFTTTSGNRTPNASFMLAEILTKITYPTGGFSEFNYEPNLDSFGNMAGSVRLKSQFDSDNVDATNTQKRYYVYENPLVIAPINVNNDYETEVNVKVGTAGSQGQCVYSSDEDYYVRNIFTKSALGSIQGGTVGYGKVTTKYGLNAENGSSVSYFKHTEDFNTAESTVSPYPPVTSLDFRRGINIVQTQFNSSGKPLQKSRNPDITFDQKSKLTSMAIALNAEYNGCFYYSNINDVINQRSYEIVTDLVKNNQNVVSFYQDNANADSVFVATNFYYDNPLHSLVTRSESVRSDGKKITNLVNYPLDYASGTAFTDKLVVGNILNFPVERVSYQENLDGSNKEIISATTIEYQNDAFGLRKKINQLETDAPIPLASFKFSNTAIGALPFLSTKTAFSIDAKYSTKINFDRYDNQNNLVQFHGLNGDLPTTILYGNYGTNIVAQLENATYEQVKTALNLTTDIDLGANGLDANQETTLRTHADLAKAMVNTYSHKPLVGLQKSTDPNGISTNFGFDNLNRMNSITDHLGFEIKHIDYHFAGQSIPVGITTLPQNQNFTLTKMARTEQTSLDNNPDNTQIAIDYADGLGRNIQQILHKANPAKNNDIVTFSAKFNKFGQNYTNILPTKSAENTGNIQANAFTLANTFYGDTEANSLIKFEASPLNRPIKIFGPGINWRATSATEKPQTISYEVAENVPMYSISGNNIIKGTVNFPANNLLQTRAIDEEGKETIQITDKEGKLIESKTQASSGYLTTHYVYNELNQLKAIIQPEAYPLSGNLTFTADHIFFYNYDARGRQIEKKTPASGLESFVYDIWDRLIYSQNALQKENNVWLFYKYDELNRPIMAGKLTSLDDRATLQLNVDQNPSGRFENRTTTDPFYSLTASNPQVTSAAINMVNFYDDYNNWLTTDLAFNSSNAFHSQQTAVKGLATGGKLKKTASSSWLSNANYFDYKYRPIQSFSQNKFGRTERTDIQYNFADELLQARSQLNYKKNGVDESTKTLTKISHDHVGRPTKIEFGNAINASASARKSSSLADPTLTTIANYGNDDIGRLISKELLPANVEIICQAVALPLDLIEFKAQAIGDSVALTWKVNNEKDFSKFELQRSTNGLEFGTLATIAGKKVEFYNYRDWRKINENIIYYRLKMIDLDGAFTFSKIISVDFDKANFYVNFENPNHIGEIRLETNLLNPNFSLVNAIGQKMDLEVTKISQNEYRLKTKVVIGLYYLSSKSENNLIIKKLILK
jgi:hypothetical protein